jgi:subtilisin-like proprotein convertase family protein
MTLTKIKFLVVLNVAWLLAVASASAGIYTFSSGTLNTTAPDGNPLGITSTLNVSGLGNILSSGNNVSVTLNLSGGNNGDLYVYLSYGGQKVTLLNRPGVTGGNPVGYADEGLNVTLSGGSYGNINTYGSSSYTTSGGQVTGTYNPADGATAFQNYNGMNPNGGWVLFVADMSGGDPSQSVLNSWSLTVTAVPEPANVALGIFGGLFAVIGALRRWPKMFRAACP